MRWLLCFILIVSLVVDTDKSYGQITIDQGGTGNKQENTFGPVTIFTNSLTVINYQGSNMLPYDTTMKGMTHELQKILYDNVCFDMSALKNNDTISQNAEKCGCIISVNKTSSDNVSVSTVIVKKSNSDEPLNQDLSLQLTYIPKLENADMFKYTGYIRNNLPNGDGKMTIKMDNYYLNNNSPLVANKGDIIIGEFKNGNPTKYTHINSKGDTLRINHIPSKYDIVFKIDSTDLRNGPLLHNKHIDITIGDLLAKFNELDNKKVSANDFESFRNVSTDKMLKRLESFWNTVSKFSYDEKKLNGIIYHIRSDSKGFFVEMPVNNRRRIDSIKRKDLILKIYFNSEWQMSDINYNFISDIEFDDNVDSLTRYVIVDLIEEFRLSYGKKDIDYITAKFDKDATIIVGQKYTNKKTRYRKYRADDVKDNRDKYLINLTGTFGRNRKVQLKFEKIKVKKIDGTINKYYILLYQHWNATLYSDEGWLQMLWRVDTKTGNATIYMREWSDDGNFTEDPNNYIINK